MDKSFDTIFKIAKGVATIATDVLKSSLNELIEKGELSEKEGENLMETLEKKVKEGQQEIKYFSKNLFKTISKTIIDDAKSAPSAADYELQKEQIRALELKVNLLIKEVTSLRNLVEQEEMPIGIKDPKIIDKYKITNKKKT